MTVTEMNIQLQEEENGVVVDVYPKTKAEIVETNYGQLDEVLHDIMFNGTVGGGGGHTPGDDINVRNMNISGNILPTKTSSQTIGTSTNRFKAIYVDEAYLSTNTLYIGDTPILGTNMDTVQIKADPNQSINMMTSGSGTSKIISESGVELSTSGMNANVVVQAKGTNSQANIAASSQVNLNAPFINLNGITTTDNLTVRGDFKVLGDNVSVEAETVRVKDNVIEINKGEVGTGVTAGFAGLRVDRGDAPAYNMLFDETDDLFKVGMDNNLEAIASREWVKANTINYVHPATHPASMITGLHAVATSGDYRGLSNKPTASDIGAATANHNHDSLYVKKSESGAFAMIEIAPSTNLDTLVDSGSYASSTDANSITLVNRPPGTQGFALDVRVIWDSKGSSGKRVTQAATMRNSNEVYIRSRDEGTGWNGWVKQISVNNIMSSHNHDSTYVKPNGNSWIGINNTVHDTKDGISLYGTYTGGQPAYGMMFTGTSRSGTHGAVTGDWATYFTMSGNEGRGWIFKKGSSNNVASIGDSGVVTAKSFTTDNMNKSGNDTASSFPPGVSVYKNNEEANGYGTTYSTILNVQATDSSRQFQLLAHNTGSRFMLRASHSNATSENKWYGWNEIYHTGKKPTPTEIGAADSSHTHNNYLPLSGGTLTGALTTNGKDINIKCPSATGGWARGLNMRLNDGSDLMAGIGFYGAGTDGMQKIYLGIGADPWVTKGLEITANDIKFKNNKIYHAGSKPTASEIGALASNANAVSATKLVTPRKIGNANFDGTANINATDILGTCTTRTSNGNENTQVGKWTKFARVDISRSNYDGATGQFIFSSKEGYLFDGILAFYLRNGGAISSTTVVLHWLSINKQIYSESVVAVKVSDGIFDLYFKPLESWVTMGITSITSTPDRLTLYNNQEYVDTIVAFATSTYRNPMPLVKANGYWGMATADGLHTTTGDWVRTTKAGIIPYAHGSESSLGTSSWKFKTAYIDTIYEGTTPLSSKYSLGTHAHDDRYFKKSRGVINPADMDNIKDAPGSYSVQQAGHTEHLLNFGNIGGSSANMQIKARYSSADLMFRTSKDNVWDATTPWRKVYHEGFKPSAADVGAATSGHTHSNYLATTGGTMTGNINYSGGGYNGAAIAFGGHDVNGAYIGIGAGGLTIVGSGESVNTVKTGCGESNGAETLHLASDMTIQLNTNLQGGWAGRKTAIFDASGHFNIPGNFKENGTALVDKYLGKTATAASATKLATTRQINGVNFDGTANITVADNTKLALSGGTITGTIAKAGVATTWIECSKGNGVMLNQTSYSGWGALSRSKSSGGVWTTGVYNNEFYINYMSDATISAGSNNCDRQFVFRTDGTLAGSVTGNAATSTKLSTARQINGTNFDGTANITTAKWGTARTLTLGNDAVGSVSVDGSANATLNAEVTRVACTEASTGRIILPKGGTWRSPSSSVTGAIEIKMPCAPNATMLKMKVSIYDYAIDESVEMSISGYYYQASQMWVNPTVTILSKRTDRDYNVRYGKGADEIGRIWIGETNSTWSYPAVSITEVFISHSGYNVNNFKQGWVISTVTSFGAIGLTQSNNYPVTQKLKTARTIALAGAVTGSASFDGGSNITITTTNPDPMTLTTISKTLTLSTGWLDTGIQGSHLASGSYVVQISGILSANTNIYGEIFTGHMSWHSEGTNSGDSDEIWLHKAGHASNGKHIYLRTIRTGKGGLGVLKLQIACSESIGSSNYTFKFRKLI